MGKSFFLFGCQLWVLALPPRELNVVNLTFTLLFKIGDGGDGGGIVLGEVAWGERALSVAREVLLQFDDIDLYAFKLSPKGYIYVRLDKLINK